jgi:hypothetical protein
MVIHQHHIIENRNGKRFRTNTTIPLSVEEHANIHKEYYEKWGFQEDKCAWLGLSEQIGNEEIFLERSRIGGLNGKGHIKTKQHRQRLSESITNLMSGGRAEEIKKKISESMKGNTNSQNHSSDEYRKTQSEAMKKAWAKRKQKKA